MYFLTCNWAYSFNAHTHGSVEIPAARCPLQYVFLNYSPHRVHKGHR